MRLRVAGASPKRNCNPPSAMARDTRGNRTRPAIESTSRSRLYRDRRKRSSNQKLSGDLSHLSRASAQIGLQALAHLPVEPHAGKFPPCSFSRGRDNCDLR